MQAMTGGARFEDLSYDGVMREAKLIDGLGQMTDSLTGPNDFELPDAYDTRGNTTLSANSRITEFRTFLLTCNIFSGTRWVGWNKSMLIDDEVEITFNFSTPRIFYHVDIHTNNMFTKDVQVTNLLSYKFLNTYSCVGLSLHFGCSPH